MSWRYAIDEQEQGPVSDEELARLFAEGTVTPGTMVWRKGMSEWQPYSRVFSEIGGCDYCGALKLPDELVDLRGRKVCAACKPDALQRLKEGAPEGSPFEAARRDSLGHEAKLKMFGVVQMLVGGLGFVLGVFLFVLLIVEPPENSQDQEFAREISTMAAIWLVLGALLLGSGWGLRRLKRGVTFGIVSAVGLCAIPAGSLFAAYGLWLVFCKQGRRVLSEDYRRIVKTTSGIQAAASLGFSALLTLGAVGFIVNLFMGLGYLITS